MSANGPASVLTDPLIDAQNLTTDALVLIVEGPSRDRTVIDAVLQANGLRCMVTADSAEARRWLSQTKPRLVILSADVARGLNLAFWLKKDAAMRSIPLIMIGGHLSDSAIQEHQSLPTRAEVYLQSPLDHVALARAVTEVLPKNPDAEHRAISAVPSSEALLERKALNDEVEDLLLQLKDLEDENRRLCENVRMITASEAQAQAAIASLEAGYRQVNDAAEREKIALRVSLTRAQEEIEALKGRLAAGEKGPDAAGNG
mgnify:CR=1 FL=1